MRLINIDKTMREIAETDKKLRTLIKETKNPRLLNKVAREAAEIIVKRTRLGFGVSPSGEKQKLKKLSKKYIEQRKRSRLDSTTSPSKSNLTFTGQMLRSVSAINETVRVQQGRNSDVANYVTEQGRPWFGVTDPERSQLKRFYENLVGKFKNL